MSLINGIHHIALHATDLDRSIAFYEGLGLKVYRAWENPVRHIAMVQMESGSCFEIFSDSPVGDGVTPEEAGTFFHLALDVDDVDAAFARALELGARPKVEPKDAVLPANPPLSVRLAFVFGPDGEELEFFHTVKE